MSPRPTKKDQQAIPPAPSVLDAVNASRESSATAVPDEPKRVQTPKPAPVVEDKVPPKRPVKKAVAPEKTIAEQIRAADPVDSNAVGDLGHYVTRVMVDARRAASEFLASVDVDAARRAALVAAQAEAEARSVLEAAAADADKIRADARLEGDRLIGQRLRIAIDLTDQLYGQANRILADADRPDLARQHLARFISELTQNAEDAAAAATLADKARG